MVSSKRYHAKRVALVPSRTRATRPGVGQEERKRLKHYSVSIVLEHSLSVKLLFG